MQVRVVKYLMSHGVNSSQISVITPYSAQRAKISRELQTSLNSCDSEVLSVFACQGMYYVFKGPTSRYFESFLRQSK